MNDSANKNLIRALTLVPAVALILANVIGTGVFVKARVMTCNVGSPDMVLLVWLVAGLLTLAGALVYAELTSMMPRAGGEFHFIGAAFGSRWAFLYGWTKTISLGASAAAVAILCVIFLNDLLDAALSDMALSLLPMVVIGLATIFNLATVRVNGHATTALSCVKVGLVLMVGLGAFILAEGSWTHFSLTGSEGSCEGVPDNARLGWGGFGAAMLGALWGYNGWAIISALGGEVRKPSRNIPLALVGGTGLIILLYLMVNAAYFFVLTPYEVASIGEDSSVAFEVARHFAGPGVAAVISTCLMISAYGTLHTTMLSGPRVPYTMARVKLLPASFGELSNRSVPAVAVIMIGVWSVVLAVSGTFDVLTDMYVFVLWIFFAMNGAAVIVLRKRYPDFPRPYKVAGYPIVPVIFILVAIYLLINTLLVTPGRALAGLALIGAGLPVYQYFQSRHGVPAPSHWLVRQNNRD
ncbi:MAG TPA: hypothetical protein DEQ32_15805 [Gammaproteobacteria bacterium]|nr:hypothetical protein [Gammaproteobacteria bacterium]|tara:strand:- start:84 stop:1484 length:1401 start_codon:yes stop_codon:yes gene_type:complete